MNNRIFTRAQVDNLLSSAKGKTLGEVDKKGLIDAAHRANPNKVQKGIAGDVIEVSVLGCNRDSKPEPDITVDCVRTELKTTGVITPKKHSSSTYEAKEPLAITGVAPAVIVGELFNNSRFCHKIEHLLFVFYHYALAGTAKNSLAYKPFPILGHMFWEVPEKEKKILENDWKLVKDFSSKFSFDNVEERHKLKENLMLVDYASPKQPRFRFKRTYVSTIVDTFLAKEQLESLPVPITKYSEIDEKCHAFTETYSGQSVKEISQKIGFNFVGQSKDTCQQLIVKMFGGDADSINQIKDFREIGLIAKTVVLTSDDGRTEDMKLFQVDFDEYFNKNVVFKDDGLEDNDVEYSSLFSYFSEHSFIFIVFQEPYKPEKGKKIPLTECVFKGFKRYAFRDSFIETEVFRCWDDARSLVFSNSLVEEKSGGGYAPNFPKSSTHTVFFRGSGTDHTSKKKRLLKWGIDMNLYIQWIWIKGKYIVDELDKLEYL